MSIERKNTRVVACRKRYMAVVVRNVMQEIIISSDHCENAKHILELCGSYGCAINVNCIVL